MQSSLLWMNKNRAIFFCTGRRRKVFYVDRIPILEVTQFEVYHYHAVISMPRLHWKGQTEQQFLGGFLSTQRWLVEPLISANTSLIGASIKVPIQIVTEQRFILTWRSKIYLMSLDSLDMNDPHVAWVSILSHLWDQHNLSIHRPPLQLPTVEDSRQALAEEYATNLQECISIRLY